MPFSIIQYLLVLGGGKIIEFWQNLDKNIFRRFAQKLRIMIENFPIHLKKSQKLAKNARTEKCTNLLDSDVKN